MLVIHTIMSRNLSSEISHRKEITEEMEWGKRNGNDDDQPICIAF